MGRHLNAQDFADMVIDPFNEMLEPSQGRQARVMGSALHAMIVDQPFRLRALRPALERNAARRGRCWLTTAGAIADSRHAAV